MSTPTILGCATAAPLYEYPQMDLYYNFMDSVYKNRRAAAIFRATVIEKRHSVLAAPEWLAPNPSSEERNQLYLAEAPKLSIQAIQKTLDQANLTIDDIDDFIFVSCTGLDCPSVDIHIAKAMGMSPSIRRAALVGMGCHGLLSALYRAMSAIHFKPKSKILIVTVELCTLHLQVTRSIPNIIGSALFGDGASAVIVGNQTEADSQQPRLVDHLIYNDYERQDDILFTPSNHGYQIHLSTKMPQILAEFVPPIIKQFLQNNQLKKDDIQHWLLHPGGIKIIDYVEQALKLPPNKFCASRAILREYGNMSSATLLFVLERLITLDHPQPGDYGILIGFGAGLTLEFVLLKW